MLAAKVDANQAAIVAAARAFGISVVSLHRVGQGVPDLLLGAWAMCPRCGHGHEANWLVEVKTEDGTLTERQERWHGDWRGQVCVVRSLDEVLRMVGYAQSDIVS